MTTVATHSITPADVEREDSTSGSVPGTDLQPASVLGGDLVEVEVVEGEIVDGPLHLNTGDQPAPQAWRAGVLDARGLRKSSRFSREVIGDLSELVASITQRRGVKLPLVVLAVGEPGSEHEEYEIVDGLRRTLAAIEAGFFQVPCWILYDENDIQLILDMLAVNENHKDLDNIEVAAAYQTMLDFGWSEQQIAQARRLHVNEVRTAVRARQLPAPVGRALNAGGLTLDMVQAFDEFDDSPDDQARLLEVVGDQWKFRQLLARLREKRTYGRARDLAKAHLVVDGVDVTPRPRGLGRPDGPIMVEKLVDADGKPLDVDTVKTLPGFHAFVEKNGDAPREVFYCDDPAALGYRRRTTPPAAYRGLSEAEIAVKQEQERLVAERVERLRLAAGVRHEFLIATFGTAKAARTLFVAALRAVALGKTMTRSAELQTLFTALGGSDPDTIATAGEDRLRRTLVATHICRQEQNLAQLLDRAAGKYVFGLDEQAIVGWYDVLAERGYPRTEEEQDMYAQLTAAIAVREAAVAKDDEESTSDEHDGEDLENAAGENEDSGNLDGDDSTGAPLVTDDDQPDLSLEMAFGDDEQPQPVFADDPGTDEIDTGEIDTDDLTAFEAAA